MDTENWLSQYKNRIADLKQKAANLEDGLAAANVTVSSPDEAVTVTIGSNGSLRDLRFSHRAAEHSYAELAALVMKTVAKGQRQVAEKVVEAFAPLGSDSNAMQVLTKFVPPEEPDEAEPPVNEAYDGPADEPAPAPEPPRVAPAPIPARVAAPAARPRPARPADDDDEIEDRPW
jgi:DNA-binding protein YbaB